MVFAVQGVRDSPRLTPSATIRDVTAERLEPAHRRSVLLVIVVTQLVVALVTGLVIWTAYNKPDGCSRSTNSRSRSRRATTRSVSRCDGDSAWHSQPLVVTTVIGN